MTPSNHAIWQLGLFKKLNRVQMECTPCEKVLSSKNHTVNGLVKHLTIHPEERLKYLETQKTGPSAGGSLDNFVVRASGSLTASDKAVIHLVAVANVPFNVLDHAVFRMLFRLFNKSELLKDEKKYYRVVVLPRVHNLVRARVEQQLS